MSDRLIAKAKAAQGEIIHKLYATPSVQRSPSRILPIEPVQKKADIVVLAATSIRNGGGEMGQAALADCPVIYVLGIMSSTTIASRI